MESFAYPDWLLIGYVHGFGSVPPTGRDLAVQASRLIIVDDSQLAEPINQHLDRHTPVGLQPLKHAQGDPPALILPIIQQGLGWCQKRGREPMCLLLEPFRLVGRLGRWRLGMEGQMTQFMANREALAIAR